MLFSIHFIILTHSLQVNMFKDLFLSLETQRLTYIHKIGQYSYGIDFIMLPLDDIDIVTCLLELAVKHHCLYSAYSQPHNSTLRQDPVSV